MARVVIFGGTGYAGGHIAREAASRGHQVISYSRNAPEQPLEGIEYRTGSLASPEVLAAAAADADVLQALRQAPGDLDWFYVSPAALFGVFAPGEATGSYRTGGDVLVTKEDGSSEISGSDFALAFVEEIENHAHPRQRFTVGH